MQKSIQRSNKFLRKIITYNFFNLLFWTTLISNCICGLPPVVKIGALFSEQDRENNLESAFKYAVYRINKDKEVLPNTQIIYDIAYISTDDSFRSTKEVCRILQNGIQAIFGPSELSLANHIQSICETFNIPHIEYRIDPFDRSRKFSVNFYPSQKSLCIAYSHFVSQFNWTRVAVIYEDDSTLLSRHDFIHGSDLKTEIYIRQATPDTYRSVLNAIRKKEIYKLIIDTRNENIERLFRAILQLQMNDYRYHYMFTTFDFEKYDLEDFWYNGVNMTSFRLIDVASLRYVETVEQMEKFQRSGIQIIKNKKFLQTESALMFDAVQAFAFSLAQLGHKRSVEVKNISCDENGTSWDDGLALYNELNSLSFHGLTGPIVLTNGQRKFFKVDILKLKNERLEKVGHWSSQSGINISDIKAFYDVNISNITLTVVTREERPYVMVNRHYNFSGNSRFEGFCIDLLKVIAERVGFRYRIELVPDNMYGVYIPDTNSWNGIVNELIEKRADLAVASMTINYARETVIDFTKPFMNLGIGILFKVPTSQPTRLFSFMNPLALEIWMYVLCAYVLVSFTLFVMARFSPYEWTYSQNIQNSASDFVENQFSISNSFWFITGTFLRQGSGLNPKATSTRIVGGIWWFFTLIIISSYTANLAAFLTVERMITPIENANDLAEQTEIAYGTLEGGSTMTFFRDSKISTYQKMWRFMDARRRSVFVNTYEDGIRRVMEGNYAFLMESTMLDYAVQRDCNLTQIGGLLDSKGYGIATPKGSQWRDPISLAILELQEKGNIQILYDKWWKNMGDVCNRDDKSKESKANALGIDNIGGVFVVLLCGLTVAVIVAILEFCWTSKKKNPLYRETQSLCSEMSDELRLALHYQPSKQRQLLQSNCVRCMGTTNSMANSVLSPTATGTYVPLYAENDVARDEHFSFNQNFSY